MNKEITTTEIWKEDKEFYRKLKLKHNFAGLKEVFKAIRKLITRHKMEGELK